MKKPGGYIQPKVNNPWKTMQGKWKMKELFYETTDGATKARIPENMSSLDMRQRLALSLPLFYFADDDVEIETVNGNIATFWSLKKRYMSYKHVPTEEYEFAVNELGGWDHFQRLLSSPIIRAQFIAWRREYVIMTKAKASKQIIELALSTEKNKDTFQASKFLLAKGWEITGDKKEDKRLAEDIDTAVEDDLGRIGLTVVK